MINRIFVDGLLIKEKKDHGRTSDLIMEDGSCRRSTSIYGYQVEIECHECNKRAKVKFYGALHKRRYVCQSCGKLGERNGFFGQRHGEDFKKQLSKERKGIWCVGQANGMFGKNVWDTYTETERREKCKKISDGQIGDDNQFYGKHHSDETKRVLAEHARQYMIDHPEHVRKMIQKSLEKQRKGFKSKIETAVQAELDKRGVKAKYSKILHRKYQFDFLIGDSILLEVQGDYWHANPKFYPDKSKWTQDQIKKVELDERKRKYAEEYGYKIFYIWEDEVKHRKFEVVDEMEAYYGNIRR